MLPIVKSVSLLCYAGQTSWDVSLPHIIKYTKLNTCSIQSIAILFSKTFSEFQYFYRSGKLPDFSRLSKAAQIPCSAESTLDFLPHCNESTVLVVWEKKKNPVCMTNFLHVQTVAMVTCSYSNTMFIVLCVNKNFKQQWLQGGLEEKLSCAAHGWIWLPSTVALELCASDSYDMKTDLYPIN